MRAKLVWQTVRPPTDPVWPAKFIDSPPFDPPSPLIERPDLSPRTETSLRRSCALILQEYQESGQIYEDISTRGYKHLDEEKERANPVLKPRGDTQAQKSRYSRHKRNDSDPVTTAPYTHVPRNAAVSFEQTAARRTVSQRQYRDHKGFEPLEPTHTAISPATSNSQDPIGRIRAKLDSRPKTSNAACVDYSEDNSSSTTRTNTTYDVGRSTGLTSAALTPGDVNNDKRFSQRINEQSFRDAAAASLADAAAKAWMTQELAKRRAESASASASAPPPSRARADPERPQSRAGSIKEGIKQYIRPRASQDSMRSAARSESGSVDDKNGKNGGTWWRGGSLRRQGSNTSLRSAHGTEKNRPLSFSRDQELNRALPALPSLDSWQEKKPKPTMHIANLMRGSSVTAKSTPLDRGLGSNKTKEKPTIIDEEGMERTLSKKEERLREKDLRKAVEEKMAKGAILTPSVSAGLVDARQKSLEREKKKASSKEREARRQTLRAQEMVKLPTQSEVVVTNQPLGGLAGAPPKKEKLGLRKKFSRFMFIGGREHKAAQAEKSPVVGVVEYARP